MDIHFFKLRKFTSFVMIVALFLSVISIPVTQVRADTSSDISISSVDQTAVAKYETVVDSKSLSMEVDYNSGMLVVTNKTNNSKWYSTPPDYAQDISAKNLRNNICSQILAVYADQSQNDYTLSSKSTASHKVSMTIDKIQNGVKIIYQYEKEGFTIPVTFTIINDSLSATILTKEIKETNGNCKLEYIDLLPYFGAGGTKDTGYMFVPDGSGALINFNNQKSSYGDYSQYIYEKDQSLSIKAKSTVTEAARMPVFGIKKGNDAFVAVIASSESRTLLKSAVSSEKTNYNAVYPEFIYKNNYSALVKGKTWNAKMITISETKPATENYNVRYFFLNQANANYTGMALRYQKYLQDEKSLKNLTAKNSYPLFLELFGGIKRTENILGFPMKVMDPLTTYSDVVTIVKQLKSAGVNNIVLKYDAWNKDGQSSSIPVDMKTDNALGGSSQFKQMTTYLNQQKVKIYLDVNLTDMVTSRWGFNTTFDSAKTLQKTPSMQSQFYLSTYQPNVTFPSIYLLKPQKVLEAATKMSASIKKYAVDGFAATTLGQKLYSDFNKVPTGREDSQAIWIKAIEKLNQTKKTMFSEPNAFAIPYASEITDVPVTSSQYKLEDQDVPFYEIVLHGYVNYAIAPINNSTETQFYLLKALESGSSLNYLWIARNASKVDETQYNNMYSNQYQDWMTEATTNYIKVNKILSQVATEQITNHDIIAPGVVMTTYGNGLRIVINYNSNPITYANQTIQPQDYIVYEK
jgi:hypothetical protein